MRRSSVRSTSDYLGRGGRLALGLLLAVVAHSCSDQGKLVGVEEGHGGEVEVLIPLGKVSAATIARAEVVVSASGMVDIRQDLGISASTLSGTVRGIPAGPARTFTINGYDSGGALAYSGSAQATVLAGQTVEVRIVVRSTSSGGGTAEVQLTIVSPLAATYAYSSIDGTLEISGEIQNPSSQTAANVDVQFTARNASEAVMDQGTASIGNAAPGRTFFVFRFNRRVFSSRNSPARSIDYTITHSLGGPDSGSVTLSGG